MLRPAASLMLLALCATMPTAAVAQGDVDPVVDLTAAASQGMVGQQLATGVRVTRVRGERRTLVIHVDLGASAPAGFGAAHAASGILGGMCTERGAAALFSEGRTLRVQLTRNGRPAGAATVDRCPASAGLGLTAAAFADSMQSTVGLREGDMTISAVRAEGNMLILTASYPRGRGRSAASLGAEFRDSFCREPNMVRGFFGNGLVLRVDVVTGGGRPVSSPLYGSCPSP
jgi:hypothetical protein